MNVSHAQHGRFNLHDADDSSLNLPEPTPTVRRRAVRITPPTVDLIRTNACETLEEGLKLVV
jgi:hypothetical protein